VQREALAKTLGEKRREGYSYLKKIAAIEHGGSLEAVYILYKPSTRTEKTVRVKLDPEKPAIHTVSGIYPAADWHEREISEMFGIEIKGRRIRRLLLENWEGDDAPSRKSFEFGRKGGV